MPSASLGKATCGVGYRSLFTTSAATSGGGERTCADEIETGTADASASANRWIFTSPSLAAISLAANRACGMTRSPRFDERNDASWYRNREEANLPRLFLSLLAFLAVLSVRADVAQL